ncbi:transcriptional regulator, LacI family [Reichenbachiella agariperforans]|uniref:Transcriptional regulator, LacI family n=1 Tax=Reichenbachiella agariperforans TaxID=156994 RepID=A0A1M6K7M7_REIAG|nr:LacI family DNA-binding transcriptional regulator [Reichenbachiella agariperforans]SHJ54820.1 transcriptional regulator, LacI family [Reichenbachiella agariperforans]
MAALRIEAQTVAAHTCAAYLWIMGKYVTLKQLAKQLNLSHTTVSRALRNHPRISEVTKQKVQQLADELGYVQNPNAQMMNQGKSRFIGIIIPDITIFFYAKIIETLQIILADAGYTLLLFNTQENEAEEQKAVQACIERRVEGVLAAISVETKQHSHFESLLKHEIPLVFFDRVLNFLPVPKIIADDYRASYQTTQHLLDKGCRCIAHVTASIHLNNSNNRLYGYMDAIKDHGSTIDEQLIHYYEMNPQSIETFLNKTLKKYPQLDGVTVFNDYVANNVVNVLLKLGKKIPEEVSVFGFSDEPIASYMHPQLSTVQQIAPKMATLATQKLLSILLQEDTLTSEKIVIHQDLILRETTRA